METASHMSRGQMLRNERGTSTPSLLTRQDCQPWLLDKLHRDGKSRDNLPPVLKHILSPSQTGHCEHHTTASKHQTLGEPDCPGPAAPSASKVLTAVKRCPMDTRRTEQTSRLYVTHSPRQ